MLYIYSRYTDREIGGWLLYYYIQLYIGSLVAFAMVATSADTHAPGAPDAAPWQRSFLLSSRLLGLVLALVELAVAEKLRRSRDSVFLRLLRTVLWTELIVGLVTVVIATRLFPDQIGPDTLALIVWPIIWIPYFLVAKRVKRVFPTRATLAPTAARALGERAGGPTMGWSGRGTA